MRSFVLGYVTIAITLGASVGCVTSQKTTGFQTNPAVNTNLNQPMGVASNEKKSGIKKFFSSFTGKSDSKKMLAPRVDPNDATSLQNRPDISPELLVVAGTLSLEKHAWESAESYFTRALKIDPNNAVAQDGLAQVARARAMGLPSNRNSDANPNNQIKTGPELNQALRNLIPKTQPSNNTFGSNPTPPRQRSMVGLNSADGTRTILASYSAAKSDLTERDYPSTQSPAPFVKTEPAIEIKYRTRGARVVNPFYHQDPVMTVAYEEEINSDEPNVTKSDANGLAATSPVQNPSSDLARLKDSLSKLTQDNSPKRNLNDQEASPLKNTKTTVDTTQPTYRRSVVKMATIPEKLVIGETKIKSIQDSEKIDSEKITDTQLEKVKVVRVIAEDLSSRRSN